MDVGQGVAAGEATLAMVVVVVAVITAVMVEVILGESHNHRNGLS